MFTKVTKLTLNSIIWNNSCIKIRKETGNLALSQSEFT